MHMICPSMPVPASTELIEFLYISCSKNYRTPFQRPLCWRRGHMTPPRLSYKVSKNARIFLLAPTKQLTAISDSAKHTRMVGWAAAQPLR